MATTRPVTMTAEDLLRFRGDPDKRYELVDGVLIEMSPPGGEHGQIASKSDRLIGNFVDLHELGTTFGAETGFLVQRSPDRVRAPDFAFASLQRMPSRRAPRGYVPFAPDFVIEIVSPYDTAGEIQERVDDWLRAGTVVVWVMYPSIGAVVIWRGLERADRRAGDDELDAEPALPGFRCNVGDLFPPGTEEAPEETPLG